MPPAAIEKGTALVEEFLAEWAKRSEAARARKKVRGGDAGGEGGEGEAEAEAELEELRKVTEEYRGRIEADPWAQRVLKSF